LLASSDELPLLLIHQGFGPTQVSRPDLGRVVGTGDGVSRYGGPGEGQGAAGAADDRLVLVKVAGGRQRPSSHQRLL